MENTKQHSPNKFFTELWPTWKNRIYSQLYRVYHPSYTQETFQSPMDLFVDAVEIVIDAAADGEKLGVINYDNDVKNNSIYSSHNLNKKDNNWRYQTELKTPGSIPLNFIEASLLFRVLEYVVDEFRHYCGETGIDPTGTGKCLDDFGWLREDYLMLRETLLQHINSGLPVEDFLEPGQLELINLTPKITTESVMRTLMTNNPKWWKDVGGNLLKENEEQKNTVKSNIIRETCKLVVTKTPINEEKAILNPEVVPGDVVELLHMDDPWHPIPVMTRGVVMGFDSVGTIGEKILVKWILDPDGEEQKFRNVPMLPDVDVWRKVVVSSQLDEQQQIQYDKVLSPKRYGNKEYVYFKGTDNIKTPDAEKVILSGPNGDITLNAIEVKNAKFGGLQVNYNRETRNDLDRLFDYVDTTKKCEFSNYVLNESSKWARGGIYRNRTFGAIQSALKHIYADNIAGPNEPTPLHLKNGFIDIDGTDAEGTTNGWSIINFFNTNPVVRRILVGEYEKYVGDNNLPCRFDIYEFTDWLENNKYDIFGFGSSTFNRLVKANQSSWKNGIKNEKSVLVPLQNLYGGDWSVVYKAEPGILQDALGGVDMSVVNNQTGEEHTYQAKPLSNIEEREDGTWVVHSGWLHRYDPKKVSHFVFGPDQNGNAVSFKNEGQKPIDGGTKYIFNSPPL